jgi:hypothetical protein
MGAGNQEMHICEKHLRQKLAEKMRERERTKAAASLKDPSRASLSVSSPPEGWAPKQQLQTLCSFIIEDAGPPMGLCFSSRWLITRAMPKRALLLAGALIK